MWVLSLDSRIRDYVLFPISIVVFMQGLLRQFITDVIVHCRLPSTSALAEQ
jgi:hypothetical protein